MAYVGKSQQPSHAAAPTVRTCLSRPILNSTLEHVPVLSLSNFPVKCFSPGKGSRPILLKDEAVPSPCKDRSYKITPRTRIVVFFGVACAC